MQTLERLTDGSFTFSAKIQDEPPYAIPFGISTYGFSYDEIDKILIDLNEQIRTRLRENNMTI